MDGISPSDNKFIDPVKFKNKDLTINGERRARVSLLELRTLWVNTGTLCNLTCKNCYIESSPLNDRLVYISKDEVKLFLDEILEQKFSTKEIGFTGGEPFMNPDFIHVLIDGKIVKSGDISLANKLEEKGYQWLE